MARTVESISDSRRVTDIRRTSPPVFSAPGLPFRYDKFADTQAARKTRPRRGKKSLDIEWRFRRIGQLATYKFRRRLVVRQSHGSQRVILATGRPRCMMITDQEYA